MILRPCICIPVYNNHTTIRQVVGDCLSRTNLLILVIDDGSDLPISNLFAAEGRGRLQFIRFAENRGKGAAIQAGFRFAVKHGYTHMLTMDGDGQHLTAEIPSLLEAAVQNPWSLIIGNRKLTQESVPASSKFGRNFSNFWVNYQTGSPIHDSQSGFRVYPLFHVQNMSFRTRHYDFEIEVLIRLLWKNVGVQEVPIEVHYPPEHERVSHFKKFGDNARISALNTVLVIISLLRKNRSPGKSALAVGLGVLIGCTPFFGFHTPIALGLAFILRLNAVWLWLGTQVSLPFIAPLLITASIFIGRALNGNPGSFRLAGASLEGAHGALQDWMVGSLALGLLLGFLAGTATWMISKKTNRNRQRPWNGRSRGGVLGNWILKNLTRAFGVKAGYFCLFFIVPYFFIFAGQARRACLEYWKTTRPGLGYAGRIGKTLVQFYRFGTVILDRIYQSFFSTAKFRTESEGYENIYDAQASPGGSILLGAHVGAWDMAAKYLPSSDAGDKFVSVQYLPEGPGFKSYAEDPGEKSGIVFVNAGNNSILKIHGHLREGKMLCLMGDRPMDSHYELVPFFGKLAPFAATPFKIAATCHAPLVVSFGFKKGNDAYRFMAYPGQQLAYESGLDRDLQILEWIQDYAGKLEGALKEFPDQWFNFYPFWSSLPVLPTQEPAKRARNRLAPTGSKQTKRQPEPGPAETKSA